MEPIALDLKPPVDQTVSLDTADAPQPLSAEVASVRASKAHYGLYPEYTDKDYPAIYNFMVAGQEDAFRDEAASNVNFYKNQAIRKKMDEMAALKGGEVSPDAYLALIDAYSQTIDPSSVIEQSYSNRYIAALDEIKARKNTFLTEAEEVAPNEVSTIKRLGRDMLLYREYALKRAQDAQEAYEKQSYIGWGVDQAKFLFPGYGDLKLRGTSPGVGYFEGGFIGSHLEAEVEANLGRPFPEFKQWLDSRVDSLIKDNPTLALTLTGAVADRSVNRQKLDNILITGADIASLPIGGAAKFALRKSGLLASTAEATKDLVQSSASGESARVARAAGAGDLGEAAVQKATVNVMGDTRGSLDPTKRAIDSLPSAMRADKEGLKVNPGNFGQEIVNRLEESYTTAERNVIQTIADMQKIDRTPELTEALASQSVLTALKTEVQDTYRGVRNAILNVMPPELNPVTNTYHYDVIMGNNRGEYFFNQSTAHNFANVYGLKDYKIEGRQAGTGYYIKINRPLDETRPIVRDLFQTTSASETPSRGLNAWFNSLVGRFRTPDEVLSLNQRENRKVATYGPAVLLKMAHEEIKAIKDLKSFAFPGTTKLEKWQAWKQTIERARDMYDPITQERGYFFKTPGDLEDHYLRYFQRSPDEQEVGAYFAYTRFVEMDRALRNILVYKHKSRVGTETHRTSFLNPETGERMFSSWFDGVIRKELPRTDDRILLNIGKNQGSESLEWGDRINTQKRKQIEAGIKEGRYKVVEVYDPENRPLTGFSAKADKENSRVRFIVTEKLETKGLSYDQVPRRGGGHFDYEAEHYVKQARISPFLRGGRYFKHLYEGDTTVFALGNRGVGLKLLPFMNEAKNLIAKKDFTAARKVVEDNLPMSYDEFQGWFRPHKVDGKMVPARLNLSEDFSVVPRNTLIGDMDNSLAQKYSGTFENGTRKGSLARQYQVQYTGERDADVLKQVFDRGSKDNPLFAYEDAKLVDPVTSIDRAMTRIVNSQFMDDYKIFSIEHWLKEAQKYLKLDDINEIWNSPFYFFNNAQSKTAFRAEASPEIVNRLLTQRMQINQFVGMPTATDTILHSAGQKLADTIYEKYGPTKLDPSWMLPKISDPFRFLRAVTFHAKLGLFSVPQLMVQANTWVNILSLAGIKHTSAGTMAAFFHQLSRINPKMADKLDEIATKMKLPGLSSWKPGEFREAQAELAKTGYEHVGGEYALRDDVMNPKMVQSGGKKFLDWGTIFFKEGERSVRIGAWYTAYREFRETNPTGRITNFERKSILERADMLSVNMSRASSSILHQGVFTIPTQFLSYQMRLAELFTGKRISNMDRLRMLSWYSGIYGMPTGLGLSGFPFGDYVRKSALDHGYTVGENWITSLMMEGIPSFIGALATGQGDIKKGNFYNIGERYGVQGFTTLRDALRSDKTMWDILGGAAFSTISNTWAGTDGFTNSMMSFIRDDDQYFPLKVDDFVDIFKEISSVNNSWRMIMALNTSRWLSKKGTFIDSSSVANTIWQSVSGLQREEVTDLQLMTWLHKDQVELEKYVMQKAEAEFRKGIRTRDENPEQSNAYFKRALAYLNIGGYPQEKRPAFIAQASRDNESLIDQMSWNFYKNAPDARKPERLQAFKDRAQMKELRGQ